MTGFDDLINRLTHRLRIDPELRMDVANELRAHLEDSAAEFRRGGYSDADATENAVKALGDETELAQNLWLANKRRVRVRQVVKWVGRVTLIPAAIVVALFFPLSNFLSSQQSLSYFSNSNLVPPEMAFGLASNPYLSGLSPEQQYILAGDPQIHTPLEREKSIVDRWPNNSVYYGNYMAKYLDSPKIQKGLESKDQLILKEVLTHLDRGSEIDPQNGYYPLQKARILLGDASKLSDFSDGIYHLQIIKPEEFNRGLAEFKSGLQKPRINSHVLDMAKLRLDILPPSTHFFEDLFRKVCWTSMVIGDLLPDQGRFRALARIISAQARQEAKEHHKGESLNLLRDLRLFSAQYGISSDTIIELLVAEAIRNLSLQTAVNIYNDLGMPGPADKARADLAESKKFFLELQHRKPQGKEKWDKHASVFMALLVSSSHGYLPDPGPMRLTEYVLADEAALTFLLLILVALCLFFGLITLTSLIRHRSRDNGPKLFFVGWSKLAYILLGAFGLPLLVFLLYAYISPINGREYGIHLNFQRIVLEYAIFLSIIVCLLLGLSYSAIRTRARDAGITVPAPLKLKNCLWFLIPGLVFLSLGLGFIYFRQVGLFALPENPLTDILWSVKGFGTLMTAVFFLYLLIVSIYMLVIIKRFHPRLRQFRRTLFRSLTPIITSAVIAVGLLCGIVLAYMEGTAVKKINGKADIGLISEIEMSNYRFLRDKFSQQHKKLLAEYLRQEGKKE